jgi:hypothetical protein
MRDQIKIGLVRGISPQYSPALGASRLFFKISIFFPEFLHATGAIDELLFPGEKGMALGANFHPDIFFR